MSGWVKLHRRIKDWEWYTDGNTVRLFFHLLLSANHKPGKWRGADIAAGQLITGRIELAKDLKLSEQQIRTSLDKLKSTNEVTIITTSKFSIITLVKWAEYQFEGEEVTNTSTAIDPTNSQHPNQQVTTNKNDKKQKKDKNISITPAKPDGCPDQAWIDFLKNRQQKRMPVTVTAMNRMEKQAEKANMTLGEAVIYAAGSGWGSFEADWYFKKENGQNGKSYNNGKEPVGHQAWGLLGEAARQKSDLDRREGKIQPLPPELAD